MGLSANKKLGQHFLIDQDAIQRIVAIAASACSCPILEVGPGFGQLTAALLANDQIARVFAVEIDQRFFVALNKLQQKYSAKLVVLKQNALFFNEKSLLSSADIDQADQTSSGQINVVANLPYNVATKLLLKWLNAYPLCKTLTLMFQKEVALRIAANPGNKSYGRLSVLIQAHYYVDYCFDILPHAFEPPPQVESTVLHLNAKATPMLGVNIYYLDKLVSLAFMHRRKQLKHALQKLFYSTSESASVPVEIKKYFNKRAEEVSVEEFCILANYLESGGI